MLPNHVAASRTKLSCVAINALCPTIVAGGAECPRRGFDIIGVIEVRGESTQQGGRAQPRSGACFPESQPSRSVLDSLFIDSPSVTLSSRVWARLPEHPAFPNALAFQE